MPYNENSAYKRTHEDNAFTSHSAGTRAHAVNDYPSYGELPHVIIPRFALRNFNRILQLYIPFDILGLALGYLSAWAFAFFINTAILNRPFVSNTLDIREFTLVAGGVVLWFVYTNHYRMRMPFWSETLKIIKALSFAALVDGFLQFALKYDFSRLWLVLGWMCACAYIILARNVLRAFLRNHNRFQVKTLLIGGGETAKNTRAALQSEPGLGYAIVAQTRNLSPAFRQEGKSWRRLCYAYGADYVIIALDGQEMQEAEQLIAQLTREAIPFSVSPPLRHLPLLGMVPQHFFNHDVLLMTSCSKLEQPLSCFIKRVFDVAGAAALLALLSPLLVIVGVWIKRDGGPALYGHMRIGRHGRMFPCYKFRSMAVNANEVLNQYLAGHPAAKAEWEKTRKLKNDPRVTKIGTYLRKMSIDELPQLINVLKGDMSLVGPRPIVPEEIAHYKHDISHYYSVRPGITGLWQVSGRNDVAYAQRVQMDSWYVRNWSLWQDIAILLKTVPAVFNRDGAY